jgi:hypothetical protein
MLETGVYQLAERRPAADGDPATTGLPQ